MVIRNRALVASLAAFSLTGGLVAAPVILSAAPAQAQQRNNVGQLLSGLINVGINVGAVNVPVTVNDVTLEELVVVDVTDVLNDAQIDILRNAIQNNPIASNNSDILNNLLQGADILNGNDVVVDVLDEADIVVGVLGGTIFVLPL